MDRMLLVMGGGAAGAGLRYGLSLWAAERFGPGWPWGTFLANLSGSFAMGLLAGALLRADSPLHLLLGVGLLGGFTTFSAFSLEAAAMAERGHAALALGYAAASVTGAVLLLVAGLALGRAVSA